MEDRQGMGVYLAVAELAGFPFTANQKPDRSMARTIFLNKIHRQWLLEIPMSVMIEIYYPKPANSQREETLTSLVTQQSGRVTFREDDSPDTICLTAEFDSWEAAQAACVVIRAAGQHVEGPAEYGE